MNSIDKEPLLRSQETESNERYVHHFSILITALVNNSFIDQYLSVYIVMVRMRGYIKMDLIMRPR